MQTQGMNLRGCGIKRFVCTPVHGYGWPAASIQAILDEYSFIGLLKKDGVRFASSLHLGKTVCRQAAKAPQAPPLDCARRLHQSLPRPWPRKAPEFAPPGLHPHQPCRTTPCTA